MALQGQGQRPFYIRWQNKMSYINQALKKAQKDKDAGHISYMRSIGRSGKSANRVSGRIYIYATMVVIILALGGSYYIIKSNGEKASGVTPESLGIGKAPDMSHENRGIAVPEKKDTDKLKVTVPIDSGKDITDKNEVLYKKAVLLLKEKRAKEALAIFREILEKDPGHVASLNDIGALYLHEGKYSDAINYLEKAVRLRPTFANPCYNLACAYALNNEPEKGMAYLKKAVDIDKEVKAWAKNDPDLNNLRGQNEFMVLIE
jgi:tetratricopeptide (TPR) repeat protein